MTKFSQVRFDVKQGETKEEREGHVRTFGDHWAEKFCPSCDRKYDPDGECKDPFHRKDPADGNS